MRNTRRGRNRRVVVAIVRVFVRRVLGEGVATGKVGKHEAIFVAVRRVPGEGVAGRSLKDEAIFESGDFAFLDRDFFNPKNVNPTKRVTCAAYGVPSAVESYTVSVNDET